MGRVLKVCNPPERTDQRQVLRRAGPPEVYDYSYDGVMRSLEFSFERLGVDAIDILFCHDMDVFTHGSARSDAMPHVAEFMEGGYKALVKLRDEKAIKAFGVGVNEWEVCEILAKQGDFDLFLLAGRYTLLEQESLDSFLPLARSAASASSLAAPIIRGILATGSGPGAFTITSPPRPRSWPASTGCSVCAAATAWRLPRPRWPFRSAIPPSSASYREARRQTRYAATPPISGCEFPRRCGAT